MMVDASMSELVLHDRPSRHLCLGSEVLQAIGSGAHVLRQFVVGFFLRRLCHGQTLSRSLRQK
jgi:hypothetical protein